MNDLIQTIKILELDEVKELNEYIDTLKFEKKLFSPCLGPFCGCQGFRPNRCMENTQGDSALFSFSFWGKN